MNCPRCNLEMPEASILSAAARIMVSRRKHARGGGRNRELPDCPHCGKQFQRLAAIESHRCPRLDGEHPETLRKAAITLKRTRTRTRRQKAAL